MCWETHWSTGDVGISNTNGNPSNRSHNLLRSVRTFCVGCDTVQSDHAPKAGIAQQIFHGILVRHHGKIEEEVKKRLEEEVERHEEEENT